MSFQQFDASSGSTASTLSFACLSSATVGITLSVSISVLAISLSQYCLYRHAERLGFLSSILTRSHHQQLSSGATQADSDSEASLTQFLAARRHDVSGLLPLPIAYAIIHFLSWLIIMFSGPRTLLFAIQGLGHIFAFGALGAYRRSVTRFAREPKDDDRDGEHFNCFDPRFEDEDTVDASIHLMHVPHTSSTRPFLPPTQLRDHATDADEYDSDSDTDFIRSEHGVSADGTQGDEDSPPRYQQRCSTGDSLPPPAYRQRPSPTTFYELLAEMRDEHSG